jgi:hypothetical protein
MEEIFGQWYEPDDSEKIIYYFYNVKRDMFRFHHWSEGTFREYDPDSSQFNKHTTFKLTLIKESN